MAIIGNRTLISAAVVGLRKAAGALTTPSGKVTITEMQKANGLASKAVATLQSVNPRSTAVQQATSQARKGQNLLTDVIGQVESPVRSAAPRSLQDAAQTARGDFAGAADSLDSTINWSTRM